MTRKQRLEMVVAGIITPELVADCQRELDKLNERGALAKNELTPSQEENERVGKQIVDLVESAGRPLQVEEIRERIAPEWTRQRVTAVCTNLVREKRIKAIEIKVSGKGKRRAYERI